MRIRFIGVVGMTSRRSAGYSRLPGEPEFAALDGTVAGNGGGSWRERAVQGRNWLWKPSGLRDNPPNV